MHASPINHLPNTEVVDDLRHRSRVLRSEETFRRVPARVIQNHLATCMHNAALVIASLGFVSQ